MTSELLGGRVSARAEQFGQHSVSFVLPAYNEEENITKAIESTISVASLYCSEFEVIVVDDGSDDRTAELVEEYAVRHPQVRLVRHATNLGYGQALRSGFSAATRDFVFYTDADNQFDMSEFPLLLAWADKADVVAGFRRVRQDPAIRRANAWCWNRLVRALFYVPVRDVDCAFKLYRRESLTAIEVESRGAMIDTEIMVRLARRGSMIVEVGVTHLPRTAGSSTGANPKVILRALREVWHMYPKLSRLDTGHPSVMSHAGMNGRSHAALNGNVNLSTGTIPVYLEISRHTTGGQTYYSAFSSPDGTTWTLVPGSTQVLAITGPLLARLAMTSHAQGTGSAVMLDNVAITPGEFPAP